MKKYTVDDLEVINDPVKMVKKNRSLYLKKPDNVGYELVTAVLDDAVYHSGSVKVRRCKNWYVVGANADWLVRNFYKITDRKEVFRKLIPEYGDNSVRSEIVVFAFAEAVFIKLMRSLRQLKVNCLMMRLRAWLMQSIF